MGFPDQPLGVAVEINAGGTWANITGDVYLPDRILIARGRADEASRVGPSRCALTLLNRDGLYSPRNPLSPLFGLIGRNTPIRVSVPAAETYLRLPGEVGARIATPDAAPLDITGDLDVRIDVTLATWRPGVHSIDLMSKYGASGARSWRLTLNEFGAINLQWSADGIATFYAEGSIGLPVAADGRLAIRATLDVDTGAGGCLLTFYSAPTLAGPWTAVEAVPLAFTTSIFNSSAPLEIGDITGTVDSYYAMPVGKVHAAEVRSGINGPIVANPIFRTQTPGATSFTDGAGRPWTVAGGAEITARDYRFTGDVSAWPSRWDVSGRAVEVPIEAAGILRRLGQGASPLDSTLRRRIPSGAPLAYWSMEDERDATSAASALPGGTPLATAGLQFATDDTLPGSKALPTLGSTAYLSALVPKGSATGAGWRVEMLYNLAAVPAAFEPILQIQTTDTAPYISAVIGAGTARIRAFDAAGAIVGTTDTPSTNFAGGWRRLQIKARQNGVFVEVTMQWIVVGGTESGAVTTGYAGTVGKVLNIAGDWNLLAGMKLGHLAVFDATDTGVYDFADTGFLGDDATARIDRLCAEEGIPVVFPGGTGPTTPVGPQRTAAALDLLADAADADLGILYEHRSTPALAFRRRVSLYNQRPALALDYTARHEVAPPLEPVDDDQTVRNDITLSRPGGSSARAVLDTGALSVLPPPNGVGRYNTAESVSVRSDDQLSDLAAWRLHLGTWDEARYPTVHVNLAAAPHLISQALAVDVGDRITIANPPPWLPPDPIDVIVQGYTESLGLLDWDLLYTCTPAGPWTVAVTDADRVDTDGSRLKTAATAGAVTLSVETTTGQPWTISAAETPWDIRIGGEVMTVTKVTGASPQTFTVVRAVNGISKAHAAGADVRLARPAVFAL